MGVGGGELKPLASRGSTKKRRMKGGQADSTKASHVRHLLCDLILRLWGYVSFRRVIGNASVVSTITPAGTVFSRK